METRSISDKARIVVAKDMTDVNTIILLSALREKNRLTYTHSLNVAYMTAQICIANKIPKKIATQIVRGALLHDIGKLFVPTDILTKEGILTDAEYEIVKQHTTNGAMLLEHLFRPIATDIVLDIVENHHERSDGTGYAGKRDISFYAQLIHAVDIYDALTSSRTYRSAFPAEYGFNILMKEAVDHNIIDSIRECCVK